MWFVDEMDSAFTAISEAVGECGFESKRVDKHQHNNDITDEIIGGIKECRFVIADLTGNRAGVYYEAGFARGIGKPVILSCRKDWFDSGEPYKKVHFDVNHLNIIVWNDPEDLKKRIIDRVKATIL